MDWQQVTTLGIVAVTTFLLVRRNFRRRNFVLQRDLPCGCCAAGMSSSTQSAITYRARKGGRPEIIVKLK